MTYPVQPLFVLITEPPGFKTRKGALHKPAVVRAHEENDTLRLQNRNFVRQKIFLGIPHRHFDSTLLFVDRTALVVHSPEIRPKHGGFKPVIDGNESAGEGTAPRWRILVLEDTGELLSIDAKERAGQGLSRLLNAVDGLLGQGSRVLLLITTNEELGALHPAVTRPGRCASQVEFLPLTPAEARTWLDARNERRATIAQKGPKTIAELYALLEGRVILDRSPLGFAGARAD